MDKKSKESNRIEEKKPNRFLSWLKSFFKNFFVSFSPNHYKQIKDKRIGMLASYFFSLMLFAFVLSMVIVAFNISSIKHDISADFAKFKRFSIKTNISLTEDIVFPRQKIVFGNNKSYNNENVLITNNLIVKKPLKCMIVPALCIFSRNATRISVNDNIDVLKYKNDLNDLIYFILLLLVPGILIFFFVYFIIKIAAIIFFSAIVFYLLFKAMKKRLSFSEMLSVAVFSSTIMVLAEIISLTVVNLGYIPLVAFFAELLLNSIVVFKRKHRF